MLNNPHLNASDTARPPKISGVAFSSVRENARPLPSPPSNNALYATSGFAPESAIIAAPITSATTTDAIGTIAARTIPHI